MTASSSAAAAARAVSAVGLPNVQLGYLPMIWYSAELASRSDFSASSTISGPIPAQSPSVIPMRGFFLLLLIGRDRNRMWLIMHEGDRPTVGSTRCDDRTPQRGVPSNISDGRAFDPSVGNRNQNVLM